MKKFALVSIMVVLFFVSASVAMAQQSLYSCWLLDTTDNTNAISGSFDTLIFLFNTAASGSNNPSITFRKASDGATFTTITTKSVAAKTTLYFTWNSIAETPTRWYQAAGTFPTSRFGTIQVDDLTNDLIGFVARFQSDFVPIYSEPLFVK